VSRFSSVAVRNRVLRGEADGEEVGRVASPERERRVRDERDGEVGHQLVDEWADVERVEVAAVGATQVVREADAVGGQLEVPEPGYGLRQG
jgi:hypothetical protein